MSKTEVAEQLESLREHFEDVNQRGGSSDEQLSGSKTTLEIQEKAGCEDAWQKYLQYFFDPSEKHSLGDIFATTFLGLVKSSDIVDPDLDPDWEDVVVKTERPGDSSRPDLLMYEPDEWFACFELKVHHHERPGQTVDHVQSKKFGELNKEDFPEEHHYYLYVAPTWAGDGEASQFEAVPWISANERPTIVSVICDVLNVVKNDEPQKTENDVQRTISQLKEFRDTIKREINVTDIDQQTRELKDLYLEHREGIDRVLEAKEKYADWFFEIRVPSALNGEYSPSYWGEDWEYDSYSGYTQIRRDTWYPDGGIDVHLEYYPNEEKLFNGKIHLRFDIEFRGDEWETGDGRRPQQVFADEIISSLDKGTLPDDTDITEEESKGIHKFLNYEVEFPMESEDDYLMEFKDALEDMEPLVDAVDDVIGKWDSIVDQEREPDRNG